MKQNSVEAEMLRRTFPPQSQHFDEINPIAPKADHLETGIKVKKHIRWSRTAGRAAAAARSARVSGARGSNTIFFSVSPRFEDPLFFMARIHVA
ncbi:hypothetical protein EVAR_39108_1 [Eumeta japonica]|uniref:Uncharacterized protein n=1 Tax=Eumeta variegata TaxID=151549 RepID=A0A4C1X7T5_EUMVA|nr:hypothetical protein EVAR_39108_1 [Eumeta japonica]